MKLTTIHPYPSLKFPFSSKFYYPLFTYVKFDILLSKYIEKKKEVNFFLFYFKVNNYRMNMRKLKLIKL